MTTSRRTRRPVPTRVSTALQSPTNPGTGLLDVARHANARRDPWPGEHPHEVDGWYIPFGPRPIKATYAHPETGARLRQETWHHGEALQHVARLMDHLANHTPDDEKATDLARAVFELIESDLQTGTSIKAWPAWNRIVDHVMSHVARLDGDHAKVTTDWSAY